MISKAFFNLFWIIAKLLLLIFLRVEIETEVDLKKLRGPLIIASNHVSAADPFLIGASFSFGAKIFPIRYAILDKIYYFLPVLLLLWCLGSFPVKRKIGLDKALKTPIKILNKGGVVGIFPHGGREWKIGALKPKRGVAYLALKTGVKILPIRITIPVKKMGLMKGLLKRYKIKIKIGKPFYLPSKIIKEVEDYNQPANYVINRIRQL
ncbi:1-acyl-sn-glycerol-3-phosphate acyltransferase [Patescibacteria group bacterium]|nr:1-acyl-sn-glycerol-3-phosphate acyltransferase [Patescibacteria group bacterium]